MMSTHHAYNNLGLVYTDIRLFALAIDMFLAALEFSPGNPAFSNNLGYAYDMTDQFDEALAAFQDAIETEPTFVDAYYKHGKCLPPPRNVSGCHSKLRGCP